jgi:hypothetical protein
MENWNNVVDFEEIYEVSNFGNIRSKKTKQLKKITFDAHNRPYLGLWKNNKQKIVRPHKLVLEAFVGKAPKGMECCHNDGNQQNNRLENLRWDTHKSNIHDRIKHGTSNRGERCGNSKLTLEQVRAIRKDDRLQRLIASDYGIVESMVSRIKNGIRWQHDI